MKKTLFAQMLFSFAFIIVLILGVILTGFSLIYTKSYEEQLFAENDRFSAMIAGELYSFINRAYHVVEELSFNDQVISMATAPQNAVFASCIERNPYFELLYAQGMDGMQTGRSSGNLGNRKNRWWFIQMEELRKPFVSESYFSVSTNAPCASVFYPITENQEMTGIMAGDIKLSALQDFITGSSEKGSWAFILDGQGVVVAHPEASYLEELYSYRKMTKTVILTDAGGNALLDSKGNVQTEEQPFAISGQYKAAIADMMAGNTGSAKFRENNDTLYISYRPVPMDGASDPWYVISVKESSVVMSARNTVMLAILSIGLFTGLIALLIIYVVSRRISVPIKGVYSVLQKIGEGDMTGTIEVRSSGEIGEMMRLLDRTRESMGSLIMTIKDTAMSLFTVGTELSTLTGEFA
ncbi:MAG: methyl-accepting chemotaxis protein, partial [Spirochaetaceae bacterium]|nr:methyl-accepting chemotaxis protein [Spirochaetaceae bacterium]